MNDPREPRATVEDLLGRRASARAMIAWARAHSPETEALAIDDALDLGVRSVMPLLTVDPPLALRAARHLAKAVGPGVAIGPQIRVRRLVAHALRATGAIAAAADAYEDVVERARGVGESLEAARTGIGWTQVLAVLGQVDRAAHEARWIRRTLRRHDPLAAARLDANLANAWMHAGAVGKAVPLYHRSFQVLDEADVPVQAAHAAFGLARAHARRGKLTTARRWLDETSSRLQGAGQAVLDAYVDLTAASLDLVEGAHEESLARLHDARERLASLGDRRAALEIDLQAASLLEALGSAAASRDAARRALDGARALGSDLDLARAAVIAARAEAEHGVDVDVLHWIDVAADHLPSSRHEAAATVALERARLDLRAGRVDEARRRLTELQPRLDRIDRHTLGAIARLLRAEIALDTGRLRGALELLRRARRDARGTTAALARPRMALAIARVHDAKGDGASALRWADRSIDELEHALLPWHASAWRRAGAQSRDAQYAEAIEIVLRHGGRRAAARAADLAARSRSPRLLEDLLQRVPTEDRQAIRRRWEILRRRVLDDGEDGDPTTRFQSPLAAPTETSIVDPETMRAPALVRRAWKYRRMQAWRRRLGAARLVLYQRGPRGWRAFVVGRTGDVRVVDLPDVETALERVWKPLRLLFETAARMPRERRALFLERTHAEADEALGRLHTALWRPLGLEEQRVFVVPDGRLHDLPLEAIAHHGDENVCVSRLPHPALVPARRRPATRRGRAVLMHGPGEGQRREVESLRRRFRRHGSEVTVARRRGALDGIDDPVAVAHFAAHGVFRAGEGRLSGLLVEDGWIGLQDLPARGVRGALLVFSSCESGLSSRAPGRDMEGWLSAGFALGAREMILTLWKVDDEGAQSFSRAFYPRWLDGEDAATAAAAVARATRRDGVHPYHWAAAFCAG